MSYPWHAIDRYIIWEALNGTSSRGLFGEILFLSYFGNFFGNFFSFFLLLQPHQWIIQDLKKVYCMGGSLVANAMEAIIFHQINPYLIYHFKLPR